MYNTILFDLDGTLTDPGLGITNSAAYALKKHGIEVTDRTVLYLFIGPPLLDSFQRFYGFSEELSERAVTDYREYFREKGIGILFRSYCWCDDGFLQKQKRRCDRACT